MLKIFISFVVASVAVIAALIFTGASLSQYIAVLISLLALALGSRATSKMHLLFSEEEGSEKYPFSSWTPGAFKFRLFLNQANGRLGREVACLGPMQITDVMLSTYKAGVGNSLCPSRQILV